MTRAPRQLTWLVVALAALASRSAAAETILFLVAEPSTPAHGDSYVLPLSDPGAIAQARDLIDGNGQPGPSIVVALIAEGADGINRDWLASGAPEWSWHVTEFVDFADSTIEILDGWPGLVEQDVPGWIANTGGAIGFWSYTVVAEVPEPSAGLSLVAGGSVLLALRRLRPAASRARAARSRRALALLISMLVAAACSPRVGSDGWCQKMKETAKPDWSAREAADFAKHCVFK